MVDMAHQIKIARAVRQQRYERSIENSEARQIIEIELHDRCGDVLVLTFGKGVAEPFGEAIDVGVAAVHRAVIPGFHAPTGGQFEAVVARFDVDDFGIDPDIDIKRPQAGIHQAAKHGRIEHRFVGQDAHFDILHGRPVAAQIQQSVLEAEAIAECQVCFRCDQRTMSCDEVGVLNPLQHGFAKLNQEFFIPLHALTSRPLVARIVIAKVDTVGDARRSVEQVGFALK